MAEVLIVTWVGIQPPLLLLIVFFALFTRMCPKLCLKVELASLRKLESKILAYILLHLSQTLLGKTLAWALSYIFPKLLEVIAFLLLGIGFTRWLILSLVAKLPMHPMLPGSSLGNLFVCMVCCLLLYLIRHCENCLALT